MSGVIVYVVTEGEYSDYRIEGLFSTREMAQAYLDRSKHGYQRNRKIEEYHLDELRDHELVKVYCVEVDEKGRFKRQWDYQRLQPPGNYREANLTLGGARGASGYSTIAATDAQHLAAGVLKKV